MTVIITVVIISFLLGVAATLAALRLTEWLIEKEALRRGP